MTTLTRFSAEEIWTRAQPTPFYMVPPPDEPAWQIDRDAYGRFDFCNIGSLRLSRIRANPLSVVQTNALIKNEARDQFKFLLQLSGRSVLQQGGREVMLSAGQWAIYDNAQPYVLSNIERVEQRMVMVPYNELLGSQLDMHSLTALQFDSKAGGSRLFKDILCSAFDTMSYFGERVSADLSGSIIHLSRLALLEHADVHTQLPRSEVMRDRVKSYINRHINDPKLSVDRIARAMNCSKRYLHKVFSESEETISHYILTQRLEKCFVQLSHESAKVHTVEQVAYYWGFTSTAHFSRVFKEHFKKTPGQCRQDNAKIN